MSVKKYVPYKAASISTKLVYSMSKSDFIEKMYRKEVLAAELPIPPTFLHLKIEMRFFAGRKITALI
ncbi:hypothetical protein SAMN04488100_12127 [Alkalibacterium putridalgicola]|uniref:Uncharacterized protein n=1 Tax=Alkalibacterium putridalgicola TaxID=426703 RepID=A0A1H7V1T9_9LACT|nr:hypothetical protein APU01nite_17170 [Alkalibacterium putridalgicola]SEM03221.1 hypothetical protein SAMN04488100_12127 [Alkalibacterium putridalgicola]